MIQYWLVAVGTLVGTLFGHSKQIIFMPATDTEFWNTGLDIACSPSARIAMSTLLPQSSLKGARSASHHLDNELTLSFLPYFF